jgi:hypothetical protein
MAKVRGVLVFFTFAGILFLVTAIAHEFGHALTARLLGYKEVAVYVWPGWQIYPRFGGKSLEQWQGSAIAFTNVEFAQQSTLPAGMPFFPEPVSIREPSWLEGIQFLPLPGAREAVAPATLRVIPAPDIELRTRNTGFIQLMGSGFTLIIALVCLSLLFLLKPAGMLLRILLAGSLLYYDLFTYTVFPYFFGAPHLLLFGGGVAEPVLGLENLGMNAVLAVSLILALSFVLSLLLYRGYKRSTA